MLTNTAVRQGTACMQGSPLTRTQTVSKESAMRASPLLFLAPDDELLRRSQLAYGVACMAASLLTPAASVPAATTPRMASLRA